MTNFVVVVKWEIVFFFFSDLHGLYQNSTISTSERPSNPRMESNVDDDSDDSSFPPGRRSRRPRLPPEKRHCFVKLTIEAFSRDAYEKLNVSFWILDIGRVVCVV